MKFQQNSTYLHHMLNMSLNHLEKVRKSNLYKNYKCNNLKRVTEYKNESAMFSSRWYGSVVQ